MRLLLAPVVAFQFCFSAAAKDYRLCIGEFDGKSPVAPIVYAGCGADPQKVAAETCAIYVEGQPKAVPYRLIHEGSHDGNRCGYEWYTIQCLE
jgi:hypothetical protein